MMLGELQSNSGHYLTLCNQLPKVLWRQEPFHIVAIYQFLSGFDQGDKMKYNGTVRGDKVVHVWLGMGIILYI